MNKFGFKWPANLGKKNNNNNVLIICNEKKTRLMGKKINATYGREFKFDFAFNSFEFDIDHASLKVLVLT